MSHKDLAEFTQAIETIVQSYCPTLVYAIQIANKDGDAVLAFGTSLDDPDKNQAAIDAFKGALDEAAQKHTKKPDRENPLRPHHH